jgi:hypothetical protein
LSCIRSAGDRFKISALLYSEKSGGNLLFSDEEREGILEHVRQELIPNLANTVQDWRFNEQGGSAEEYYQPLQEALEQYSQALEDDDEAVSHLQEALRRVDDLVWEARHWRKDDEDQPPETSAGTRLRESISETEDVHVDRGSRSVFDDVDE